MRHKFEELIGAHNKLIYTGRAELSAPAVGYASIHVQQQAQLVARALGLEPSGA
jgi:2-oxoglutarate dehydrogenase complex dehydrogenase (E1) component-like enzyme